MQDYLFYKQLNGKIFLAEDYLIKAEIAKKWAEQDQSQSVTSENADDPVSVESLLNKLNKDGKIAMYYSGGLNLLAQCLTDSTISIFLLYLSAAI